MQKLYSKIRLVIVALLCCPASGFASEKLPDCVDESFHNCFGNALFENGDKYTGNFQNGKANGYGFAVFSNGDTYAGDWKDWVFQGKGTLKYANGEEYKGQFFDGMRHGDGTLFFTNGDELSGSWHKDNPPEKTN